MYIGMVYLFNKKKIVLLPMIWLFIYFAVIPMQLASYVLCVGDDGHVRFEYSVNGSCTDIPSHDFVHTPLSGSICNEIEEEHCGECVDFPIFTSLNTQPVIISSYSNLSTQYTIYTVHSIITERILPIIPAIPLSSIPPLIDPTLISLQTVTLLI